MLSVYYRITCVPLQSRPFWLSLFQVFDMSYSGAHRKWSHILCIRIEYMTILHVHCDRIYCILYQYFRTPTSKYRGTTLISDPFIVQPISCLFVVQRFWNVFSMTCLNKLDYALSSVAYKIVCMCLCRLFCTPFIFY